MYAGMCSVGVVAGWLARVHKHYDQFRERSEERLLAPAHWKTHEIHSNVAKLPPAQALRGENKRGNVRTFPDDE